MIKTVPRKEGKSLLYKLIAFTLSLCFCTFNWQPRNPTPQEVLSTAWSAYKTKFIQHDGRTIEWRREQITTSEGQSYAMLRAVWMNDRATFEIARQWANRNLSRTNDRLYSWKWGKKDDKWEILDLNSASDADQDIAYALLLAAERWNVADYRTDALKLLEDIWRLEVVTTPLGTVLTAGNWANQETKVIINPSYLAPYAYRLFARVDKSHPWADLIDGSYRILAEATSLSSVGLIPDWCAIDKTTGKVIRAEEIAQSDLHSYDAWRTAWRVAFDAKTVGQLDQRPQEFLKKYRYMLDYWAKNQQIPDSFLATGESRSTIQNLAALGAYLPAFAIVDPQIAQQCYEKGILTTYEKDGNIGLWGDGQDYYAQNWVWFGIALWSNSVSSN
jgi:endoglucanase